MGRYRTINVDLNRQYRNDLNANFAQIEQDILGQENFTVEMKNSLLTELTRIERESKERDNALIKQNLEVLLQSIEDAKANANNAATNANTKATHAQNQGDYAKSQGDYAKNQGDYAKSKGDYANEKAILADEAASNANAESSNLSQLKVDVTTATQNANTAKINADTATTKANIAASYATNQGDYAKLQGDRAKDVVDGTGLLTQTDIGVKVAGFNTSGQVLDKNGNVVEGKVKTVNDVAPDGNGNITLPTFSGNYDDLSNKPTIPSQYELPVASPSVLGGIKIGQNLSISEDGVLNAIGSSGGIKEYIYIGKSTAQSITSGSNNFVRFQILTKYGGANFCEIDSNSLVNFTKDGLYIAVVFISFASNATGIRRATLTSLAGRSADVQLSATNNDNTIINLTLIKRFFKGDRFDLSAYQNSGSAIDLTIGTHVIIARLGD